MPQANEALGVIMIGWQQPVGAPSPRLERLMRLLAAEAAVAIERAALLDRLERMAHTDDLTGLGNRRAWDQAFEREIARARREDEPLAVAMLDLDHFKNYTTATATRPATGCSARRPAPGAPRSARPICSPATAARSSRWHSRVATSTGLRSRRPPP